MERRLQDVKTYYICPDHNDKYHTRKLHMDALLATMEFTNFHHYKSGTEAYPACLNNAIIDILQQNMDEPVLILEDDVECSGALDFAMPDDVDAIYFGLSISAGSETDNVHYGPAKLAGWSETQARILNMLGGHAILYVSRAYKDRVIKAFQAHAGTRHNTDVLMSRLHKDYLILANRKPAFWQSNRFNAPHNLEHTTKVRIPENSLIMVRF
jgi:hypothetical protein